MYRKYRAVKIDTPDGKFDSKKEYNRWLELKKLQAEGTIRNLERQVSYELIPKQLINDKVVERACTYKADFVYEFMGDQIVEDVKGYKTPEYKIKRKLLLWVHHIRITEL